MKDTNEREKRILLIFVQSPNKENNKIQAPSHKSKQYTRWIREIWQIKPKSPPISNNLRGERGGKNWKNEILVKKGNFSKISPKIAIYTK